MRINHSVDKEQSAAFRIYEVHGSEMLELRIYADNFLGNVFHIVFLVGETCYQGIGISHVHHHHSEVITIVKFVVNFLESATVSLFALVKFGSILLAKLAVLLVAQIHDFYVLNVQVESLCLFRDFLCVSKENGFADSFL